MKCLKLATVVSMVLAASSASAAIIIDDFSVDSSGSYIQSVVLDQNATVDTALDIAGGVARVTKTAGTEAEQNLYLRSDHTLDVGETLLVDYAHAVTGSGNRDFGIAVATTDDPMDAVWTSGTANVRQGYVTVYVKPSAGVNAIAFDTGGGNLGSAGSAVDTTTLTGLYISRIDSTTFDVGYSTTAGDTLVNSYTVDTADYGSGLGFYSDVRSEATVGDFDNLRIVPEPTTVALGLLGAIGLTVKRRRQS